MSLGKLYANVCLRRSVRHELKRGLKVLMSGNGLYELDSEVVLWPARIREELIDREIRRKYRESP
jgi:hypothetical protein